MQRRAFGIGICICASALIGCSSDNGGGGGGETGSVFAQVTDAAGSPVSSATVTAGDQEATTNEQGFFTMAGLPADVRAVLSVKANGYARTTKVVTPRAGTSTFVKVTMTRFDAEITFDSAEGGTVAGAGGSVNFPADSLGTSGMVKASLAVLNANDQNDLNAFPGEFVTDGQVPIETLGLIAIEVTDMADNAVQLKDGAAATVQMPVTAGASSEIPLWSLDESTGRWVQEGTLTNCSSGVCEGQITHMSWWNADQVLETTCLEVCVEDADGSPAVGVWVEAQGVDYNGRSSAVTGTDGCACLDVKRDATVGVIGVSSGGVADPITHNTSAGAAMCGDPDCDQLGGRLVVTPPKFQAVLTWGETPSDLDTHFTGPCVPDDNLCTDRFWVSFENTGSLLSAPYAALDTDDTSSFGPEILTLTRSFPGVYRYSVHNFSGSPDITQSMASVLLLLPDGSAVALDIPTGNAGGADTWIVGELTCQGTPGEPTNDCAWETLDEFGNMDSGAVLPPGGL